MGDVPIKPEPEESRVETVTQFAAVATSVLSRSVRTALTGSPAGRIRRFILFIFVAVALGSTVPQTPLTILGFIAAMLLALTDAYLDA